MHWPADHHATTAPHPRPPHSRTSHSRTPHLRTPHSRTPLPAILADTSPYASRHLVVLNPAAGQGDPERVRRRLGAAFAARRLSFDLVETTGAGDAALLARRGAELGYRAVVAVGGDGTIGEVITGLAGTETWMGVVPRGTGNQVAANLRLPVGLERAVEVIAGGATSPMDVGQLGDGRYFALAAGAGWDAEVIAAATRELKDRWGFGAYLFAGLRAGMSPPVANFRITADGETLEVAAAMVLAANMGSFVAPLLPRGVRIAPDVSFRDGMLDVCIFAPRTLPDVAAVLWRMARGVYAGDQRMIYLRAREVRVESDPAVVTEVDGEVLGATPLVARAVAGGVRVLVPAALAG